VPIQQYISPANTAQLAVATAAVTTATTTTISPSSATTPAYSLPGGLLYPGMAIRFTASGTFTLAATGNNTTFQVMSGGSGGVVLGTTGVLALKVSVGPVVWWLDGLITCRSIGTSGTLWTAGAVSGIVATAPLSENAIASGSTFATPAVATVDTTIGKTIDLVLVTSAATSTSVQLQQWVLELIG
jgi:hypothetical protein